MGGTGRMGGIGRRLAVLVWAGMGMGAVAQDVACTSVASRHVHADLVSTVASTRERSVTLHSMLPAEPDTELFVPVAGVRVADILDTWGADRGGGRVHEGQDIFAPHGTPVYSATEGYVLRIGVRERGGVAVWVAGAGDRRYYYAHLAGVADIEVGTHVTPETVLGYVGATGNAAGTPPHLHFGVYSGSRRTCDRRALDPLPLLVDR